MELNICHLYPDLLNAYGDIGNVLILKYRAEQRGINVNVLNCSIGQNFEKEKYDIVFFGGGQSYEQSIVSSDLINEKKAYLQEYVEDNGVLLAICGAYQLLGKYYVTAEKEKLEGLNILDIYTEEGSDRLTGNAIIFNEEFNENYVGFENHSGRTYIGDLKPLGTTVLGHGNNREDGTEGCIYKNTFCSYFHGSLLSKNPDLADRLLLAALQKKYDLSELSPLDDSYEIKAREHILALAKNK
jgi:CobQ-like glutamine amidotransferase family enzyme